MTQNNDRFVTVEYDSGETASVKAGVTLLELSMEHSSKIDSQIMAAKVNNEIRELGYRIKEDCSISFISLRDEEGIRIYCRSLYLILIKAVHELFPEREVKIQHSISKGTYCEISAGTDGSVLTEDDAALIEDRMRVISGRRIPFKKMTLSLELAKEVFSRNGRLDRYHAIEHRAKDCVTIYDCDGFQDYFYGYMAPDTGFVKLFALKHYHDGIIVMFPEKQAPEKLPEFIEQKKLFAIFKEYIKWGHILGVDNVGELNDLIMEGQAEDLIRISEALHEKKIAHIADMVAKCEEPKRIILISGPSSSGKTTFAKRLSVQLRVNGLKPVTINMDNYFVNREKTPRDEKGGFDYEALEAIDVKLFNTHLKELIGGAEVEIPIFNFFNGCREPVGKNMKINEDNILVIEGIHGLNEKLTGDIPADIKFKIYVSALTSMNIDDHNRIPSTDTRILRRIVRDNQFRGTSATNTIKQWPSVRNGESRYIFPYQESADIMFNSSHMVELGILKNFAEPLLKEIDQKSPVFAEAKRLLEFLSYFLPIDGSELPRNSIIREFIGGGL